MAHRIAHRLACLVLLLAVTLAASEQKEQSRWSRQLSTYTTNVGDWIPLRSSIDKDQDLAQTQDKRQSVAEPRILTEPFPGMPRPAAFNSDPFSSRNYFNTPANRQLYLQSVPSAPQNFLSDQGFNQGFRFGLSQPNFPLNQGFVGQPFNYENVPPPPNPARPQAIPVNPVNFPQSSSVPQSIKTKPFSNLPQRTQSDIPKFVDGYRAENISSTFAFGPKKKPQSLQKIKFESGERIKQDITPPHRAKSERGEEVQLLYVPLDQLNRGQFNFRTPIASPQLLNTELYSQGLPRPNPGKQTFLNDYQRPPAKPLDSFTAQNYFSEFNAQLKDVDQVSKYTTPTTPFASYASTTPKPKKLKPHQPPLAIFTIKDVTKNSPIKVGDVLSSLKNADTIAVLDSVNPLNAPKVFIGPSNLAPPQNYVKFDLPYLSNIEHSDSKLKQLPFFVAPLSYNTPNGFAKIPFPSPHVGSVVINSQIKDSSQTRGNSQASQPNINTNYYVATSPTYKTESTPTTPKTTFSYYSTATPKTKPTTDYQSNYYSFEPQTVSTIRPPTSPESQAAPSKTGSYFLSNTAPQYNSQEYSNFPQDSFKPSQPIQQQHFHRQPERTTTTRTTTTVTKRPSTYSSQLLETHNPYSINQAFHFSTPLDFHSYFDDVKQPHGNPNSARPPSPNPVSTVPEARPESVIPEKTKHRQQLSPSYLNNYTPEIHYDSNQDLKYHAYNDYNTNTELTSQKTQSKRPIDNTPVDKYNSNIDTDFVNQYNDAVSGVNNYKADIYNKYSTNTNTPASQYNTDDNRSINKYNTDTSIESYKTNYNKETEAVSNTNQENLSNINNSPATTDLDTPTRYDEYNNYEPSLEVTNINPSSPTTTPATTTTTRKSPIRTRGRPRYTTTPRYDSYESNERVITTRRPQRERRPITNRPRYEPNKISTENPIKDSSDSEEIITNSPRSRTRGRVQYKPSDDEESYERKKSHNNQKEEDLAYQRDVLHQNYPVTLTETMTTKDIEAITETTLRQSSYQSQESNTETIDTENAYTNEKAAISEHDEVKDVSALPTFTARSTLQTEFPYVPNLSSTRNEEYYYKSRSSLAPVSTSSYDDTSDRDEDIYVKQTTPLPKPSRREPITRATETISTEQNIVNYSNRKEYTTSKQEEFTTVTPETETTPIESQENHDTEEEQNVVQTTPSYNRVRIRPGVIRQYHPASTTETSKPKERRRPSQPITYRPAFDRRRTTMRIDEIEAGLKTKQVHIRPEQEHKHPVYKPEASTESDVSSSSSTESTTKRSNFRRRRPSYSHTTTTTEASSTKRIYDVKNRFRGRRPTEKTTEKPEKSTEAPSSTTRTLLHSRFSHRPRFSERYNKKPDTEAEVEDQDSNYSINRPKYVERSEQWSPKVSSDSFKPYNPNDIVDEHKIETTERRSDRELELDIITARNEYEDILLAVTPASNNRMNKKIPDIPPTLEALVEQSKVTKSDSSDSMSTFESMLEEVMKSLEEQDKDEYNSNVMKHKGGEIGEIPPEQIISSGDNYSTKPTTDSEETTTDPTTVDDSPLLDEDDENLKSRRRGFWKKVKVRPVTTESIEFAESQYYSNTVNHLGHPIEMKTVHKKSAKVDKPRVTTYKPNFHFLTDLFSSGDDLINDDIITSLHKLNTSNKESDNEETLVSDESKQTTLYLEKETPTVSPGDLDLGTGSPDSTIDDLYFTTPTEPTPTKATDRADMFSFMDYFFGVTAEDSDTDSKNDATHPTESEIQVTTEQSKLKTTETAFIPDEITALSVGEDRTDFSEFTDIKKVNTTEAFKSDDRHHSTGSPDVKVESSSVSSFMDPVNVLSTSMSTEISHETEICFRGKCIKTNKDLL